MRRRARRVSGLLLVVLLLGLLSVSELVVCWELKRAWGAEGSVSVRRSESMLRRRAQRSLSTIWDVVRLGIGEERNGRCGGHTSRRGW